MSQQTQSQAANLKLLFQVSENCEGDSLDIPGPLEIPVTDELFASWKKHAQFAKENDASVLSVVTIDDEKWDVTVTFNSELNDWQVSASRLFRIKHAWPGSYQTAVARGSAIDLAYDLVMGFQSSELSISTILVASDNQHEYLLLDKTDDEALLEMACDTLDEQFDDTFLSAVKKHEGNFQDCVFIYSPDNKDPQWDPLPL
jgi:hypothetical protein